MCFATWNLNSKNRDFPQGKHYFFTKSTFFFCFEVEIDGKHKKNKNKSLENQLFFLTSIFDWFWTNLGGCGGPSWPSNNWVFLYSFQIASKRRPRAPQERPKHVPRAPKSASRAPQGYPRAPQELPKGAQEHPKSVPRASKRVPRASKSPRVQKHAANGEIWTTNVWRPQILEHISIPTIERDVNIKL